jgi:hypothetical protein
MGNRKKPDTGVKGACPPGMPPPKGRKGVTLAIPLCRGKDFSRAQKKYSPIFLIRHGSFLPGAAAFITIGGMGVRAPSQFS